MYERVLLLLYFNDIHYSLLEIKPSKPSIDKKIYVDLSFSISLGEQL